MTKEESIVLWELEQKSLNGDYKTKDMENLYKLMDKLIRNGVIMYDKFVDDIVDVLTEKLSNENEKIEDRLGKVTEVYKDLYEKYQREYPGGKLKGGDTDNNTSNENSIEKTETVEEAA